MILKNFNFLKLWVSQLISQGGTKMYQIAMMWWIITNKPDHKGILVGLFMVLTSLPAVILAKWIGKIIDNNRSSTLLILADIFNGLAILFVSFALWRDSLTISLLFVVGFIVAFMEAFFNPTLSKCLPEVVSSEEIEPAVAFQTSTQSIASFGGAIVGALLIDILGFTIITLINSISYFVSMVFIFSVKFRQIKKNEVNNESDKKESMFEVLNPYPFIKRVLITFGIVNFFLTPILIILPIYTKTILKGSASSVGLFEASLWLGLVFGVFVSKWVPRSFKIIDTGFTAIMAIGIALMAPNLFINPYWYSISMFIAGTSLGVLNVKFVTLFQLKIAPEVKGRFFAIMQALISFSLPVAFFIFGVLIDYIPLYLVILIQAFGVLFVGIYLKLIPKELSQEC